MNMIKDNYLNICQIMTFTLFCNNSNYKSKYNNSTFQIFIKLLAKFLENLYILCYFKGFRF